MTKETPKEALFTWGKRILAYMDGTHHPKKSRLAKCGVCWDREMFRAAMGDVEREIEEERSK